MPCVYKVPGLQAAPGKAESNDDHYLRSWFLLSAQDGGDAEGLPQMDAGHSAR